MGLSVGSADISVYIEQWGGMCGICGREGKEKKWERPENETIAIPNEGVKDGNVKKRWHLYEYGPRGVRITF